jgi:hypothetical protein
MPLQARAKAKNSSYPPADIVVSRASCRSPAPSATPRTGNQPAMVGRYRFSTADLRIDLDTRTDGTYYASMDSWTHVTEEQGSWHPQEDTVLLERRAGGLPMPIQRLAPVSPASTDRLQIVEPDSQVGRAIIFSKRLTHDMYQVVAADAGIPPEAFPIAFGPARLHSALEL